MSICVDCKIDKHDRRFYRRADSPKRMKRCKECHRIVARAYRKSVPNYSRGRLLKQKYGITLEQYQAMFESQAGACAMCKRRSERSLCVDHDHATGHVRALLCNACNAMIGFAQEDASLLQSAIVYIRKYNGGYQKWIAKTVEAQ